MKKHIRNLLLLFMLIISPFVVQEVAAQPPPPPPQDIPLDGGLTFLIIAGAAYGARKLYKKQKEEEKENI